MKEGWEYKKLIEVARVQNGFAFDSKLFNETNEGKPLIRIRDIKKSESKTYTTEKCPPEFIVNNGDLLVGMDGDFNVCIWNGGNAVLNQRVCKIIPSNKINIRYLYYYLPFPLLEINDKTPYSIVKHLSSKQVLNIVIPVPPLPEQERIVALLDAEFDKIDLLKTNAEHQLKAAKDLFQSALKEMLTPQEGWEMKTLEELSTDIYRGSGITREQIREKGIPCVRYGEIYTTYNYWFDKCVSHTDENLINSPKYFTYGDILFTITGESVEDIAKSVAYLGEEKCLAGGDIVVMKHQQNPKYLSYALSTPDAIRQKGLGKTKLKVVHSNVPSIKAIIVPIPSLKEQQEIADKLDEMRNKLKALQANYTETITLCNDLKQSLLKSIFE